MSLLSRKLLFAATLVVGASFGYAAAGEDEGVPAAPAAMPPLAPVTPFDQFGAMPGAPYSAVPGADGGTPGQTDISASPPPLSNLAATGDPVAGTTVTLAAGPIETFEFLFREDPEMGVVRERYSSEEALQRRNLEIQRLLAKYQQPSGPGGVPGQQQGVDPRGAAEWDFYFEQLQLYSEYIKTRVLRTESSDFPEPTYDAETAIQNADDLERFYNEEALRTVNNQWNESLEFYDRISDRADRRREFLTWVTEQERNAADWTDVWARRINGANWTDQQPVGRDDWYYGTHFNAAGPVLTEIAGQQFLFSREPQHHVDPSTLNVLSTNLTPYDVVDYYGNVKSPAVERVRGTIVRPTPAPIFEPPVGVVEMAE